MANKLYNEMNGQGNPLEQSFSAFMNQMRGQNPDQIIQQMVQSGKISQQQLNAVQHRAKQMSNVFGQFKSRFGF